jgi:hypothetical protein
MNRLGQTVIMQETGVAVLADQEIAAEAAAEAERIDVEVGQVHEVDRVGEADVVAVRRRLEAPPEPFAPRPTSFCGQHDGFSRLRRPGPWKSRPGRIL